MKRTYLSSFAGLRSICAFCVVWLVVLGASRVLAQGACPCGCSMELNDCSCQAARFEKRATTNLRSTERWLPVNAPLTSDTSNRSEYRLQRVIEQFDVETNPRYTPGESTWCNIFVWDVTRALGAEIPHWGMEREMQVNDLKKWLENEGYRQGWWPASAEEAVNNANEGRPSIVAHFSAPSGSGGHIAIVRPGNMTKDGPAIAQAGRHPKNATHVDKAFVDGNFQKLKVEYWIHY